MDNIASAVTAPKNPGFFKHIFDDNYKGEFLNVLQYGLFIVIPLTILIRNLNYFFPELDETKGHLEILIEALGQLGLTFVIILFVHRIITYFAPWGGVDYADINMSTTIMLFLWIVISFGLGHIGKKVNFLLEKLMPLPRSNFWSEGTAQPPQKGGAPRVRITQPLARLPPPQATHIVSKPDYITRQNQVTPPIVPPTQGGMPSLPVNTMYKDNGVMASEYSSMGGYNQALDTATMEQGGQNFGNNQGPVQTALQEGLEPMAANEALGGGFSSF